MSHVSKQGVRALSSTTPGPLVKVGGKSRKMQRKVGLEPGQKVTGELYSPTPDDRTLVRSLIPSKAPLVAGVAAGVAGGVALLTFATSSAVGILAGAAAGIAGGLIGGGATAASIRPGRDVMYQYACGVEKQTPLTAGMQAAFSPTLEGKYRAARAYNSMMAERHPELMYVEDNGVVDFQEHNKDIPFWRAVVKAEKVELREKKREMKIAKRNGTPIDGAGELMSERSFQGCFSRRGRFRSIPLPVQIGVSRHRNTVSMHPSDIAETLKASEYVQKELSLQ